ncbi:predicted protein [Histoplasma capsulatum var. duboisii H88]|uniref:Predicted protein n=1 Tax=Ajellomyces capsulatus (strain H88) TaxID=544711 RepID=F0UDE2_AJEC8|nr:predicted protein [Histoplasma capsulatum var. duboisii H88]
MSTEIKSTTTACHGSSATISMQGTQSPVDTKILRRKKQAGESQHAASRRPSPGSGEPQNANCASFQLLVCLNDKRSLIHLKSELPNGYDWIDSQRSVVIVRRLDFHPSKGSKRGFGTWFLVPPPSRNFGAIPQKPKVNFAALPLRWGAKSFSFPGEIHSTWTGESQGQKFKDAAESQGASYKKQKFRVTKVVSPHDRRHMANIAGLLC